MSVDVAETVTVSSAQAVDGSKSDVLKAIHTKKNTRFILH